MMLRILDVCLSVGLRLKLVALAPSLTSNRVLVEDNGEGEIFFLQQRVGFQAVASSVYSNSRRC